MNKLIIYITNVNKMCHSASVGGSERVRPQRTVNVSLTDFELSPVEVGDVS